MIVGGRLPGKAIFFGVVIVLFLSAGTGEFADERGDGWNANLEKTKITSKQRPSSPPGAKPDPLAVLPTNEPQSFNVVRAAGSTISDKSSLSHGVI